jgi:hypothetical protein
LPKFGNDGELAAAGREPAEAGGASFRRAIPMSARLPSILAGVLLCSGAAFAQSSTQVGLVNPLPTIGLVAPGLAGVLSGTNSVPLTATTGPGGTTIAPGPAGAQDGGIQNQPGQAALSIAEGCTIPSPTFKLFSSIQFGTTTANPNPLPLTNLNGC